MEAGLGRGLAARPDPRRPAGQLPREEGKTAGAGAGTGRKGVHVDGWRQEQPGREAQGHIEDAGLLSGPPAPRGSAQPPYLFQLTKQCVW